MSNIRILLTLDGKQYQAELDRAGAGTRKFRNDIDGVGSSATVMANALRSAGVAVSLFGAVQVVRNISDMNVQFDRTRIALGAVSETSLQAGRRFEFVLNTAERLGVQNLSLAQGYVGLTAAARGTNLEGARTDAIFSAIVESGARLNISQADIQGILRATQQIMSKGTLSAEELRQQLGDRLPGAVNIAARALGVTTAELNEMLIRGEIASDVFLPRFAEELRRTFGTSTTTRIDTNAASFQRLRNEISLLADEIGSVLNPALAGSSNVLANALRLLRGDRGALQEGESDLGGGFSRVGDRYLFRAPGSIPRSATAAEIESLQSQQLGPSAPFRDFSASLTGGVLGRFGGTGRAAVSTPEFYGALRPELQKLNEEQQKAVDKAREHFELLRLETEEARVLYQIRSGSLRDTTKQEQDFLLAAARLRDAQAAERKSSAEARKASAQAAREEQREIEEETRIAEQDLQRALRAEEQARDQTRRNALAIVGEFDPSRSGRGFRRDLRDATSGAEISSIAGQQMAEETAVYLDQIDRLQNHRDEILQMGLDYNALEVAAWRLHEEEKTRISREANEARLSLMSAQADVFASIFGNLADTAQAFGERGFRAYKAFAIAEATASMISGAVGAFARASSTFPPPLGQAIGAAAAAAVVAAGTVKIAQIRSLEYGGGRERGGSVQRDRFYEIGERGRPEIVESAGRFFMFDAQGRVNAARSGGAGGGAPQIQIFNNTAGVEVKPTVTQRSDGVWLTRFVVNTMQREFVEEGPAYRALQAKTGITSRPVSRG